MKVNLGVRGIKEGNGGQRSRPGGNDIGKPGMGLV